MDKQQAFNNIVAGMKRLTTLSMDEGVVLAQSLGVIQLELGLGQPAGPPLAVTAPMSRAERRAAKATNGAAEPAAE